MVSGVWGAVGLGALARLPVSHTHTPFAKGRMRAVPGGRGAGGDGRGVDVERGITSNSELHTVPARVTPDERRPTHWTVDTTLNGTHDTGVRRGAESRRAQCSARETE